VTLPRLDAYSGCKSWVELPVTMEYAAPIHDSAALTDIADRVRRLVG